MREIRNERWSGRRKERWKEDNMKIVNEREPDGQ
jgi:hypothetical protein